MEVIPAIDLRDGKVVRLHQGDYQRQTTYADDPVAVAQQFEAAGAPRLHVVDLDGALAGTPVHVHILQRIVQAVRIPVQMGGGLGSLEAVDQLISVGVERVVLGTGAVTDHRLVQAVAGRHGESRVVVGLDARDGLIAVKGWTEATSLTVQQLMATMAEMGVGRFIYTDIARDGTLTEPNFNAVAGVVQQARTLAAGHRHGPLSIIAAGGIGSIEHLEQLATLGVEGAIVGSALYEGGIDLAQAIRLVGRASDG